MNYFAVTPLSLVGLLFLMILGQPLSLAQTNLSDPDGEIGTLYRIFRPENGDDTLFGVLHTISLEIQPRGEIDEWASRYSTQLKKTSELTKIRLLLGFPFGVQTVSSGQRSPYMPLSSLHLVATASLCKTDVCGKISESAEKYWQKVREISARHGIGLPDEIVDMLSSINSEDERRKKFIEVTEKALTQKPKATNSATDDLVKMRSEFLRELAFVGKTLQEKLGELQKDPVKNKISIENLVDGKKHFQKALLAFDEETDLVIRYFDRMSNVPESKVHSSDNEKKTIEPLPTGKSKGSDTKSKAK